MRRVYLDVCALNRPFDDQRQMRVQLETAAMQLILSHIEAKTLELALSPAHWIEVAANPLQEIRLRTETLLKRHGIAFTFEMTSVRLRAEQLFAAGFGPADAAHVAYAEAMQADFISVDDRLLRSCRRSGIRIWCGNPTVYCDRENLR